MKHHDLTRRRQNGGSDPSKPHSFEPRAKGSPRACQWCGAVKDHPIHGPLKRKVRRRFGIDPRGQALVEFAVILPIMLLLILGTLQIGLLLLYRSQLTHVAQEAAVVAAIEDCDAALDAVPRLLGREVTADCTLGELAEVRLTEAVPVVSPVGPFTVDVTGRAAPRIDDSGSSESE